MISSWLKPPYLYLLVNFIIITVFASSWLQSKLDDNSHTASSTPPTPVMLSTESVNVIHYVQLQPTQEPVMRDEPVQLPTAESVINVVLHVQLEPTHEPIMLPTEPVKVGYASNLKPFQDLEPECNSNTTPISDELRDGDQDMKIAKEAYKKIKNNIRVSSEKPPPSVRLSRRKHVKAIPEAARTFEVAKPKRQDRLDTTWNAITAGQSTSFTENLRKSNTWESHDQGQKNANGMTKLETFGVNQDGACYGKPRASQSKLSRAGGSRRLKKESSLRSEELNQRVEVFIKKLKEAYGDIQKIRDDKFVIGTPSKTKDVELSNSEKSPAFTGLSRRKQAKAIPEGARMSGVAKPKRQDTLDTTWKAITNGRTTPFTKYLPKSNTWDTRGQARKDADERMTKSETFDVNKDGACSRKPPASKSKLRRASGSGRLRKEPSLGQEELNRRVEAFIKKFNEDMRLQRQESYKRYKKMISRVAR